jgi:putative ABC transport system substrate-binding protein
VRKKIFSLALGALLLALIFSAQAQQPAKIPRIGYLTAAGPGGPNIEAFRQGLRDLRYIEGKNILIEYRYAEGKIDRLPELAFGLVNLKLDLIVVASSQAASAAKRATYDHSDRDGN